MRVDVLGQGVPCSLEAPSCKPVFLVGCERERKRASVLWDVCRDTVYTDFVSVITCEARRGPRSTSTCMELRLLQDLALD